MQGLSVFRMISCTSIGAVLALGASTSAQTQINLPDRGVTFQIPAGWKVAPDEMLASMNRHLKERAAETNVVFISGLVPESADAEPGAYVLIQFQPLKTQALNPEDIAKLFNIEYTSATMKDVADKLEGVATDYTAESSVFEPAHDRYVIATNMNVPGLAGKRRNFAVGYLQSDGVLQFNCYAPVDQFAKYQEVFTGLTYGVSIQPEKRYRPVVVGGLPAPSPLRTGLTGNFVPIVATAVVATSVLVVIAIRRRKARLNQQ